MLAEAVAAFVRDLPDAKIMPLARRSNLFGALDMGLAPSLLPGRAAIASPEARSALGVEWATPIPETTGRDAAGIISGLAEGQVRGLFLFGSDPIRDFPDQTAARAAIEGANLVVAIDQFLTDSSRLAHVVLPAAGFTEVEGTVTNLEGRVQKVARLVAAPGQSRPPWSIFEDIATSLGTSLGAHSRRGHPEGDRPGRPRLPGPELGDSSSGGPAEMGSWCRPRMASSRFATCRSTSALPPVPARLALHSARTLYDDGVHVRFGLSLAQLAAGAYAFVNPEDAARLGIADGALVRLDRLGRLRRPRSPARPDPGSRCGLRAVQSGGRRRPR